MSFEDTVERILLSRRTLTRDKVLRMIEEKKAAAEGFFTEEAAARMVASDLAVEIPTKSLQPKLEIKNLISGLDDVTVTGRVIIVYPPRTFTYQDMREGKAARLLIADGSGTLGVVLWDEKVSIVEHGEIKQGQIAKFSHGYTRKGLDGKLELHMGSRAEIQTTFIDADEDAYPPIAQFLKKIGETTKRDKKTNVVGIIQQIHPPSTFQRKDGTPGKVRRLQLEDDTGRITVVLWNQKADELGDIERGDYIQIMGARVKEGRDSQAELQVESKTQIQILENKPTDLISPSASPIKSPN